MPVVSENYAPTAEEQALLELINRARANPSAEYDFMISDGVGVQENIQNALSYFGVDLALLATQLASYGAVAPLAWNGNLALAADRHNDQIIAYDTQSHQLPGELSFSDRFVAAGYASNWSSVGENVYAWGEDALFTHAGFYIDWGTGPGGMQSPAGHRDTILNGSFTEVGIAVTEETNSATSVGPSVTTQNFASHFGYQAQLVGVVIDDGDGDGFYDIGEGMGGISVVAQGTAGVFGTQTWSSGGYQFELPAGTYTVTFSGGALNGEIVQTVTMGYDNLKLDALAEDAQDTGNTNPDDDVLVGDAGDNSLSGEEGNDLLSGQGGDDTLSGGAGNDTVSGGDGNDLIFSGTGMDQLSGDGGNDTLYGAGDADTLLGGDGADLLGGGAGDDSMDGGLGYDALWGSGGNDTMLGQAGNDTLGGADGNDSMDGGYGNDEVWTSVGDDTAVGGLGDDTLGGSDGNDSLSGDAGNDEIWGAAGNDTLEGGDDADQLGGGTGNDSLDGGGGTDSVYGGLGDDSLDGGDGNDELYGAAGNDTLEGGTGNDTLYGGPGADVFVFGDGDGSDEVHYFSAAEDRIQLDDALWGGGLTAAQVVSTYGFALGSHFFLNFGNSNMLNLMDQASISGLEALIDIV